MNIEHDKSKEENEVDLTPIDPLFNSDTEHLYGHRGISQTLIDDWTKKIARGEVPDGFASLQNKHSGRHKKH